MQIKMDTDAVRSLSSSVQNFATSYENRIRAIKQSAESANWQSQAREEFIQDLNLVVKGGTYSVEALRLMSRAANRKVDQWEAIGNIFNGPFYFLEGIWDSFKNYLGSNWNNLIRTMGSIRWPTATAITGIATGIVSGFTGLWPNWDFEKQPWWPFKEDLKNKVVDKDYDRPSEIIQQVNETSETNGSKVQIGLDQDDPRWGSEIMGKPGHTIDNKGCLITSVAMIARSKGLEVTPIDVNNYMKNKGGYAPNSSDMYWGSAENYLESVSGSNVTSRVIPNTELNNVLSKGNPVIIKVPGSTNDGHWVVATGINAQGEYIVYESATGKESTYNSTQLLSGHRAFIFED